MSETFITFPMLRIEQDTEENTPKSVQQSFTKLFGRDKRTKTKTKLIHYLTNYKIHAKTTID